MTTSRLALGVSVLALAAAASPAFAQTAPAATPDNQSVATPPAASTDTDDKDIVVTGSRIARSKYDTVEPVLTLDDKQIEARGFTTLGQALNQLPAFGVADSSPVGGQSSFGPGQSFVNFFGLGSQRTLTLVNGRRFVGSNTSTIFGPTGSGGDQVDLNVIPTKLIDRVETVAVGGAPIYGSDAIAGTINVILKKDYQGFELDGQYQIAEAGDVPNYRIRALAGHNFAGGRGNITIAGEYNEGKGILYTDRYLSGLGRYYDNATTPGYGYTRQFYNDRRIPLTDAAGIPMVSSYISNILGANVVLPPKYQQLYSVYSQYLTGGPIVPLNGGVTNGASTTSVMKFDPAGNLIPVDFGLTTSLTNASGGNGYSLTDLSNLLTNTRRYNGIATGSFQITDHVRVFGEAWYSHSEGTNLRDQPEYNGGLFGAPGDPSGQVILSLNNPFLSPAARAQIQNSISNNLLSDQNILRANGDPGFTQNYFLLDRANTDLVSGRVRGQVDLLRFIGGFDGDFQVGGNTWKWEIAGNYGKSTTKSAIPVINTQNFDNAVGAITASNPNGIPCLAGLTNSSGPTISSTCAPLNLFGIGVGSQAARDYVTMIATPKSVNTQKDFTASLTGPLFKLPGGNLSFAIGFEHREEHENFNPSAAYLGAPDSDPNVDSNGDGDPTNDRTSYGQVVPIAPIDAGYHTNEVYGEVNAQLIGPDNNIPGFHSLEFQGALRYVDNSVNGGAFTWTAGGKWAPVKDLTIRGNFTRSIRSPSITENQNPAQSFFDFATDPCDVGNLNDGPNKTARKANCTTALNALGVDPTTFSALSDDRSFTQAVQGDPSLKNEQANSWTVGAIIQPRFIRGLTISADYVDITVKNVISSLGANQVLSDCYDSTTYPNNTFCSRILRDSAGQLSYIVTGYANQDQLKFRGIVAQGDFRTRTPFLGKDSSIGIGVSYQHLFELSTTTEGTKTNTAGNVGYAKDKGLVSLSYDNGPFEYYVQAQYIGPSYQDINLAPTYEPFNREHAIVFTNMALAVTVNKNFQFRLGVDNVFNTKPPYPSSGTSDVYFAGALGRYFRVGAGVKF